MCGIVGSNVWADKLERHYEEIRTYPSGWNP
jgi:hypothetical protein